MLLSALCCWLLGATRHIYWLVFAFVLLKGVQLRLLVKLETSVRHKVMWFTYIDKSRAAVWERAISKEGDDQWVSPTIIFAPMSYA